jgi:hypothetical protein
LSEEERIKTFDELKHRKEEIDKMTSLYPIKHKVTHHKINFDYYLEID